MPPVRLKIQPRVVKLLRATILIDEARHAAPIAGPVRAKLAVAHELLMELVAHAEGRS